MHRKRNFAVVYLDDFLYIAGTEILCAATQQRLIAVTVQLNILVNLETVVTLGTVTGFLVYVLDSVLQSVEIPEE